MGKHSLLLQTYDWGFRFSESLWTSDSQQFQGEKKAWKKEKGEEGEGKAGKEKKNKKSSACNSE